MPPTFSRTTLVVICSLVACLTVGSGGSPAAVNLEARYAVTQARAAAAAVQAELAALENSLLRAHASVRASAFAHDDQSVTEASRQVQYAAAVAATTTRAHLPVVTTIEQQPPDPIVASVLNGNVDAPHVAHVVIEQLEDTHAQLDQVRSAIDDEVRELDQSRSKAKHGQALEQLDHYLAQTDQEITAAESLLDLVENRVDEPEVIVAAREALAATKTTIAAGHEIDRQDAQDVDDFLQVLTQRNATFDFRLTTVAGSHATWIETQNESITQRNDAALEAHDKAVQQAWEQFRLDNHEQTQIHSNGWDGKPHGVSGLNGRLAADSLCEVDFAPGHRLQCDAAAALIAADAEYFALTGKHLQLTDSYRSYGLQQRTWALKPRTAARPGTSNHGWGMAVDMDRDSALWLSAHGADYGWVHPQWARPDGHRPEWWHLEYVGVDVGTFVKPEPPALTPSLVSIFEAEPIPEPISANAT